MYPAPGAELSQAQFFQKYNSHQIAQATINYNLQSGRLAEITGTYYETDANGAIKKDAATGKPLTTQFVTRALLTDQMKNELLPPNGTLRQMRAIRCFRR